MTLHSAALLDLFLFSHASMCSTMTFLQLGNADHFTVSVSAKAAWNGLCDHLRDILCEDIF